MIVNTGSIAPKKPGVYIVTTDTGSSWSYFTGWFNGQYWYEFSRADAIGNNAVPRKKCARLAVTAWAEIDNYAFSDAIKENQKAPVNLEQRIEREAAPCAKQN